MIEEVIDYAFDYKGKFVLHGINSDGLHEVNTHDPTKGSVLESRTLDSDVIRKGRIWNIPDKVIVTLGGVALLSSISNYVNNVPVANDYSWIYIFMVASPYIFARDMLTGWRNRYDNLNLHLTSKNLKRI